MEKLMISLPGSIVAFAWALSVSGSPPVSSIPTPVPEVPFCTAVDDVDPDWSLASKRAYCSQFTCNFGDCWWNPGNGRYCDCV